MRCARLCRRRQDGSLAKPAAITYDWAKRPATVPLSSSIASGSIGYTYRLDGLLKSKSLPGGTETATLAYDAARRPTAISFTVAGASAISQTYDRAGNVTSEARNLANAAAINGDAKAGTLTYTYDELDRLMGSTGAGGTRAYRYDLDGNRVYKSDPARTLTYAFDRTDQPINETNGTSTAFVDDAYGNLTKKAEDDLSQTTLAYDAADRLTGVTPAAGSAATFSFDALGRNKTRVIGGTTTDTYAYLGTSETVSEVATSGGTTRTIDAALGPDGSRLGLRNQTSSTQVWTLFDLHGDVAALENSAMSAVSDALRYDGYGVTVDTDGSFGSPWKFQGALDVAPGSEPLYDIGARMYAPSLGSWTSLDSVAGSAQDPLSMNRFLYAEANPATLIDPTGHAGCDPGRKCHAGNNVIVPNADGSTTVYHQGSSTTYNVPSGHYGGEPQSTGDGGAAPPSGMPPMAPVSSTLHPSPADQSTRAYIDSLSDELLLHFINTRAHTATLTDYAYLYAKCRAARLSDGDCQSYMGLKDWSDLDGPVGTLLVAPVAAVTMAEAPVILAEVAAGLKTLKDQIQSLIQPQLPSSEYTITAHALDRITERVGGSLETVATAIDKGQRFVYWHEGVWKTGFFDPASRVFVGTYGNQVLTVIDNVSDNYITNLQAARP